jgi:hypothetical protein
MAVERRAVLITREEKLQSAVPVTVLAQARGIDLAQPYVIVPDPHGNDVYVQAIAPGDASAENEVPDA